MSCPACFSGSVHDHAEPKGTIETIHGIRTYVAGGSDPSKSKSTIIYLPDIFSLKLVNNKILADEYAAGTGCKVYLPDVVYGGGMSIELLHKMDVLRTPNAKWTVGGVLAKASALVTLIVQAVPFMMHAHPEKVYPQVLAYARAVKADLPEGGKLGVAGFCWGAWPSTKLCAEAAQEGTSTTAAAADDDVSKVRLIDAQFNGHPSYIIKTPQMVVDAISKFKVPYTVAVAVEDMQFNKAEAEKVEALVRSQVGESGSGGCTYEFRMYDGCVHGFCVRAPVGKNDDVNEKGFAESKKHAIDWYNKYLN
ncbi:hypothetical protein PV08_06773 [Exophiala spinifera]|uniref:Dienelactone hydrolase domain-containing protein n=1 Tax=Exophiala spinifera TaxID=91928 RepID=A0A0D1ZMH4_9EURO|nr:uncharacterized protein PV08_06773 [Exophiala spinifera]KIW13992.1 hypothetical protein PV08_06773 [Exophiala spinifera]